MEFCLEALEIALTDMGESPQDLSDQGCKISHPVNFVARPAKDKQRRSRSAGLVEGAAKRQHPGGEDYGGSQILRRCTARLQRWLGAENHDSNVRFLWRYCPCKTNIYEVAKTHNEGLHQIEPCPLAPKDIDR